MDDLVNYDSVPTPKDIYRLRNPAKLDFYRNLEEHGDFDLSEVEQRWAEDYNILLTHGYQLRPRFHPGWTPSWRGTDISPMACEDSIEHFHASVIDAKRLEDGKIVTIKRVSSTHEADVAQMLSTPECIENSMNHCVPIYDYFVDDRDGAYGIFIVMPLLREFNDPPFTYVDEVIDFVRQTLEGLIYLHSNDVAHRDLSDGNIMMEGRPMYGKQGFHPSNQRLTAGNSMKFAKPCTRRDAGFVKYFFTDFELSTHFGDPSSPRLVTGIRAQDKDIPELSEYIPYDPFAVDVFTLGMVYKRNFLDQYSNINFLASLCATMTEQEPHERPSASEALEIFQQAITECCGTTLRWHLRTFHERRLQQIIGDFHSAFRELAYWIKLPISSLLLTFRTISL